MTQINMPSVNTPTIGDSLYKSDDDIFKDYFKRKVRLDECDIEDECEDEDFPCPYFEEDPSWLEPSIEGEFDNL